jgi:hypothetical protein
LSFDKLADLRQLPPLKPSSKDSESCRSFISNGTLRERLLVVVCQSAALGDGRRDAALGTRARRA